MTRSLARQYNYSDCTHSISACTVLYCTVLHWTVLYCTALTVLFSPGVPLVRQGTRANGGRRYRRQDGAGDADGGRYGQYCTVLSLPSIGHLFAFIFQGTRVNGDDVIIGKTGTRDADAGGARGRGAALHQTGRQHQREAQRDGGHRPGGLWVAILGFGGLNLGLETRI